jgi:hypothetical protein
MENTLERIESSEDADEAMYADLTHLAPSEGDRAIIQAV